MKFQRVTINVSGVKFETLETTLKRFPETLLGDITKRAHYYSRDTKEYFFNRNRKTFEAILYFYQSNGDLRLPPSINVEHLVTECQFFQIPEMYVTMMKQKAGLYYDKIDPKKIKSSNQVAGDISIIRKKIWDFLENPETSKPAYILAIFSLITIFLSVILACLQTLDHLQEKVKNYPFWENPFNVTELILNGWFLLEVTARFIFSPRKILFLLGFLNIIDIVGVVPYFAILIHNHKEATSLSFLRMLRFLRVLRLFRLSKHSVRIKVVGAILKDSIQDLYVFFLCLMIMTIFSGAMLYFMEQTDPNTLFDSIPESMWWALQTVVTLGYGDIVPVTWFGRLYSAFFMVFGALTIALPVLSIVMKFSMMYGVENT